MTWEPNDHFTENEAARAAAVFFGHPQTGSAVAFRDMLNAFAPLVAAREREQCAKIAETVEGDFERDTPGRTESAVRRGVAAAIRARHK